MKVAVMLACFNRKEMTQRCIVGLKNQFTQHQDKEIDIYVYDDKSTDGTVEMLKREFPEIIIFEGNGQTYWCKSMYCLMKNAVEKQYDFYLMINDDVEFYDDAIEIMFNSYNFAKQTCGIVGATQSAVSGKITYGGRNKQEHLLIPNGNIQRCIWANWNCFLIDNKTLNKVGIIDGKYKHSWGDFDYSHRMYKLGIPIYEASHYIGVCESNSNDKTYKDKRLSRKERLKKLFSPKGMPFSSYLRYNLKTKGLIGGIISIYGYCSIIAYILMGKEIK